jgi:hypothetical protein
MIEGSCHCGAARWRFDRVPDSATACNCTLCRRYGALWAYGWRDEEIHLSGPTRTYRRGTAIDFHFCESCACIVSWQTPEPGADGRRWIAVNLRLAEPDDVAGIPLDHFDGLHTFKDLGQKGRVKDIWF